MDNLNNVTEMATEHVAEVAELDVVQPSEIQMDETYEVFANGESLGEMTGVAAVVVIGSLLATGVVVVVKNRKRIAGAVSEFIADRNEERKAYKEFRKGIKEDRAAKKAARKLARLERKNDKVKEEINKTK